MITKNKDLTFAIISLFAILFLICFISAQSIYSNPQYTSPGFSPGLSGIQGISGISGFNAQMCGKSQDFILQIAPFGCSPAVVRSDLLEERNVPVFCPVLATKINPLIDVEAIESMTFRGEYSPGVSGVGFYPARAAVKRTYSTLINSPTLENVGYAVIVLNQQPNESAMPNFVQGNLTAFIRYDIENAYGIGPATRYLPLIDNDEWSNKFRQYGFWNGKALLRAEDVEDNSAVISIYLDENNRLTTQTLRVGETSNQIYLPGYYCAANLRLRLDSLTVPNTRAKLSINGEIVEVGERERFLENLCRVTDIEKNGLFERVDVNCRTDPGSDGTFSLINSPELTLSIDENQGDYQIGDKLYESEGKFVYFAYAEAKKYSNDEGDLDLVVFLKTSTQDKERLDNDEISKSETLYKQMIRDEKTSIGVIDFSLDLFESYISLARQAYGFFGKGEIYAIIPQGHGYEMKGKTVFFDGLSEATNNRNIFGVDERLNGRCVVNGGFEPSRCGIGDTILAGSFDNEVNREKVGNNEWTWNIGTSYTDAQVKDLFTRNQNRDSIRIKFSGEDDYISFENYLETLRPSDETISGRDELEQTYENAMSDYREIIDNYPSDKPGDKIENTPTFAEQAFVNSIILAEKTNQKKTMVELCKEFRDSYPDTSIYPDICENALKIASSEIARQDVIINGKIREISFDGIYEPSSEEFGAEISIRYPNNDFIPIKLTKNEVYVLNEETGETIQLLSLNDNSAVLNFNLRSDSFIDSTLVAAFGNPRKTLREDVGDSFGSKYTFTLTDINLEKQAKVSVIPGVENAGTEANLSFKIGIEKRAIQLSPSEIKNKINNLNDSINKWEGNSEALGNVVKGFNGMCLATGTALTVKNFFENLDGKSISRQEVMRSEGGWTDICDKKTTAGEYSSLDACFLDNTEAIDKDVEAVHEIIQSQEAINEGNLCGRLGDIRQGLGNQIVDPRNEITSQDVTFSDDLNAAFGTDNEGKCDMVSLTQARDLERLNLIAESNDISAEIKTSAEIERYKILSNINSNVEGIVAQRVAQASASQNGLPGMSFPFSGPTQDTRPPTTYQGKSTSGFGDINSGKKIQGITLRSTQMSYYVALRDLGSNKYAIDDDGTAVYDISGNKITDENIITQVRQEFSSGFIKRDSSSYNNNFLDPKVQYFETGQYKGLPALVPFDLQNGWYAVTKQTFPGFGGIRTYDDSGNVGSFYLCNVGFNGKAEFNSPNLGDDECQQFNPATGTVSYSFAGIDDPREVRSLVDKATRAINSVASAYRPGISGVIRIGTEDVPVGEPAVGVPEVQCQDFMSPSECNLLFNVCDPVVCPSSRCNLGGNYYVADVVQSGIVGSALLCLPNIEENIYVPVCLTGIKAGIDSLISVQKSYRDCLQTNLDTGKTIGICDEIHSIYLCDFFWDQAQPISQIAVPKIFEFLTTGSLSSGKRGGGEYLAIQSAWQNAQDSANYFTSYYGNNAFQAFNVQSTNQIGSAICRNFISATYPTDVGLSSLIEPRSPPQFTAWFSEQTYTTATVPATSQYKVFYHIFAGENTGQIDNIGVYYNIYLRSPSGVSFYQTNPTVNVASGYIAPGGYASETRDFIAPEGYKELCVRVNAQEECGFKQVSTDFSLNYLKDKYLEEEASRTDIMTETECVAGTPSALGLINPNLQAGAEEALNPEIYNRGIIRVCATDNPGKNTDSLTGTKDGRWQEVGTCDNGEGRVKCYIDTQSVKDTIKVVNLEDETLDSITERAEASDKIIAETENVDKEIKDIGDLMSLVQIKAREIIQRINNIVSGKNLIERAILSNQKAQLYLFRGDAHAQIVKDIIAKKPFPGVSPVSVTDLIEAPDEIEISEIEQIEQIKCESCGDGGYACYKDDCGSISDSCLYTPGALGGIFGGTCIEGDVSLPLPEDRVQNILNSVLVMKNLESYDSIVSEVSLKYYIPDELIKGIILQESNAQNPSAGITDNLGSWGLMQVSRGAVTDVKNSVYGVEPVIVSINLNSFETEMSDAKKNIYAGTLYYTLLYNYYFSKGNSDEVKKIALAAYNWGRGNINDNCAEDKWVNCKNIPPEVLQYVANILEYERNL